MSNAKETLIQQAAEMCAAADIEPEILPTAVYLQEQAHPQGRNWAFIFCVCVEMGHIYARREGYANQWDRASARMTQTQQDADHA